MYGHGYVENAKAKLSIYVMRGWLIDRTEEKQNHGENRDEIETTFLFLEL